MLTSSDLPRWLQVLLTEKFFNACVTHEDSKKNEKNVYCLECCTSICSHCSSFHTCHKLLQIRRYVYHDVIRLEDATKLMDCAFVQSYIINSAKVIFINQRPHTKQFRGSGNFCTTCDRCLQHPYLFCSLSCKVNYVLRTEYGVSEFLLDCNFLALPDVVTPEPSGSTKTSSCCDGYGEMWCSTAITEIVRKKRSSLTASCHPVSQGSGSLMNRRKKTPNRAPLS